MAFIFLTLMNHTRMVLEAAWSTRWWWSSVWFRTYNSKFVSVYVWMVLSWQIYRYSSHQICSKALEQESCNWFCQLQSRSVTKYQLWQISDKPESNLWWIKSLLCSVVVNFLIFFKYIIWLPWWFKTPAWGADNWLTGTNSSIAQLHLQDVIWIAEWQKCIDLFALAS